MGVVGWASGQPAKWSLAVVGLLAVAAACGAAQETAAPVPTGSDILVGGAISQEIQHSRHHTVYTPEVADVAPLCPTPPWAQRS